MQPPPQRACIPMYLVLQYDYLDAADPYPEVHRLLGRKCEVNIKRRTSLAAAMNKYMARSKQRCEEYDARRAYPFPSSYPPHEVLDMQRMLRAYGDARAEWNRSTQCEHAWRGVLHRGTARRCDKSRA